MSFQLQIANFDHPDLGLVVGLPDQKVRDVLTSDRAAINLARSLVARFDKIEGNKYYRYLGDNRFYVDFEETDPSITGIINDFLLHGEYEPATTALVKDVVKEGMVCMDIGASIGYFTLLLGKRVGKLGKVYSIEATSNQFPYLRRNIEANGLENVEAYNIAAWDREELIHINANAQQKTDVQGKALDSIFRTNEPIDFIKMDIDGSEPKALLGLEETIKRSPNLKMVIEYYPKYIEKLGLNPQDVLDFLDKYFTYDKIEGDLSSESYCNLYCTRKES